MATFRRPGTVNKSAFGISFDADRDVGSSAAAPSAQPYNKHEQLALAEQRARLPIAKHRREILYCVETHATTVIVGETGSGKTTQVPQYLFEAGWCGGGLAVVCTQPRRVAVMTVAARVAQEVGCTLGQQVGYAIRFEDVQTQGVTGIKYCTDGVLLREMMGDPLLSKYSVVMVDEAHERSLSTDLLLGLLKKVQRKRPGLRLIISSATLQAQAIADFFNTSTARGRAAPAVSKEPLLLSVEGRAHDVQVHYMEEPCDNYVQAAVQAAVDIHTQDLPGDVLIFLTGQEDCEGAVRLLEEEASRLKRSRLSLRMLPLPLYAGLPAAAQLQAFQPAPRGHRKVVVATNIAETSVTLEGVVFVIDALFAKVKAYNPLTGLDALLTAPISKASALQRAGRAGRVRPGHCFRLATLEAFQQLSDVMVPEMQRSNLAGVVLTLKAMGIDNIMTFEWLAPPPAEAMLRALELLRALGALDDDARLSRPLGLQMSELAVEPPIARFLLASLEHGCAEEALTLAAMLSVHSVWRGPSGDRRGYEEARNRFAVAEGDLITYLNVWKAWTEAGRRRHWADRNFLHHRTLLRAADIRGQLEHQLKRFGAELTSAGRDVDAVRRALTAGLFFNAAQLVDATVGGVAQAGEYGTAVYRLIRSTGGVEVKLRVHPSSVLWRVRAPCLLFATCQQGDSGWYEMQDVCAIDPAWLPELAPHMYHYQHKQPQG